jgi:hypothetical protein
VTTHVVYRFFAESGELLYVGVTSNPVARFRAHEIQKSWWSEVADTTLEEYPTRQDALTAEQRAICAEMPRYNVIHKPLVTFSLAEVAEMVLPPEWTDCVRWLVRRLNRGEISGYKIGRTWRMTEQQLNDLIAHYTDVAAPAHSDTREPRMAPTRSGGAPAPLRVVDGLSARSRRRLNRGA